MKKFIKANRIFLSVLLLLLVIISVLLSLRSPAVSYKTAPDQIASLLKDSSSQVSPITLYSQLSKGDKSMIIIDVRSSDEFAKGHIDNAVNIPVRELLQERSLELLRELKASSTEAILYGNDQLQANGPWMLLKQLGFSNLKYLMGGYAFYKTLPLPDSLMKPNSMAWLVETNAISANGLKFAADQAGKNVSAASKDKKTEKVVPVKKAVSRGGGC